MKILFITLGFLPAVHWGGPVKVVYQNARELQRRGHSITVYCTNLLNKKEFIRPGTFERQLDGIRVVYFHTWRLTWWPGTLGPIWLPHLGSFLKRELSGFDIVHLNGYRNPMLLQVARAAYKAGIPTVGQPHGAMPVIVNSYRIKKLYDRLLGSRELAGLEALIVLQESERQQALEHNFPADRIVTIPNGLDPITDNMPKPGIFRRRYGLASDLPLILFLGRINRKKGTDMLIESFARLSPELNAQLAIVGPDDGQLQEVLTLIRHYDLQESVFLTGLLQGTEVMAAFQDADLFVLPCRIDTFPFAIIESCSVGTPMVITDRCEIAHLVKGRVADVAPFDVEEFALAIERLLMDSDRYQQYRDNCPQIMADTFSVQAVVDRLEILYEYIIERKRVPSEGIRSFQCPLEDLE